MDWMAARPPPNSAIVAPSSLCSNCYTREIFVPLKVAPRRLEILMPLFPRSALILLALLAAPAFAAPAAPQKALPKPEVPQSLMQVQLSFAPVVKRVASAVVNVYARSVV